MSLKQSDWRAIQWFMEQESYTIRDMMAGPIVRFRNTDDKIVDINIDLIRAKYVKRPKANKKVES